MIRTSRRQTWENNTDGEENSTLTEDVDETDETEAEKQKTTEVKAAEKTDKESDTEQKMKTIYEVVEAEPDLGCNRWILGVLHF